MTMEEARVVVLQRAVALLVASIDKNRLHALTTLINAADDPPEVRKAGDELARLIQAAGADKPPGKHIPWPRRA